MNGISYSNFNREWSDMRESEISREFTGTLDIIRSRMLPEI